MRDHIQYHLKCLNAIVLGPTLFLFFSECKRYDLVVKWHCWSKCVVLCLLSSDYRHNGRDFQSSTLSVPEQVMSSNHCSRSDMTRTRSRSPSVPPPQRYKQIHTLGMCQEVNFLPSPKKIIYGNNLAKSSLSLAFWHQMDKTYVFYQSCPSRWHLTDAKFKRSGWFAECSAAPGTQH